MPQTTSDWRANASETELRNRAAEMRSEWSELSKSDRESDSFRNAKTGFLAEMDDIDVHLSLRQMEMAPPVRNAPAGAFSDINTHEVRSAGELVTDNAEFRAWASSQSNRAHLTSESPSVELRALVSQGSGDASGAFNLLPVNQPYLANVNQQRLFLRDLLTVQPTGLAAIHYVRESGAVSNETAATVVAEGATKPEAQIVFTPDIAPMQVIADNIPITTQVLEDSATVVGYINGRLVYMLKLAEEKEVLNGDGTGAHLKGLRTYTEKQTQAATAGETAITIANAIVKIETRNGFADGVAMNPIDAWAMFTKRAAGGAGTFDAGTPFANIPLNVWGLPVARTISLPAGTALVGSYRMGATLFDRQQANVRVYEQHSDFAVKNKVLLQAEERVGLAVNRPDWFVEVTIA